MARQITITNQSFQEIDQHLKKGASLYSPRRHYNLGILPGSGIYTMISPWASLSGGAIRTLRDYILWSKASDPFYAELFENDLKGWTIEYET